MSIQTNSILLVSEVPADMMGFENPYTCFYAPSSNHEAEMLMKLKSVGFIDLTEHSTHCEAEYAFLTKDKDKLISRIHILRKRYDLLIIVLQCFDFEDMRFIFENAPQLSGVEIYAFPLERWERLDKEDDDDDFESDPYDFSPIVPADVYIPVKQDVIDDPYLCEVHHLIDGILTEKHPIYDIKRQVN